MKKVAAGFASFLITALLSSPALAYFHSGGGSWSYSGARGTASGGGGSWHASGYRGGSASGGGGSWSGTGFRGGTASGGGGSWSGTGYRGGTASGGGGYWHATTPYGTTAYGGYNRYYGGAYSGAYHPPAVVNSYAAGCYNCGGWYAAGAAVAGAAVGAAVTTAAIAHESYAIGAIYSTLPAGCAVQTVNGATYYSCSGSWFSPAYGANGVYYRVVTAP